MRVTDQLLRPSMSNTERMLRPMGDVVTPERASRRPSPRCPLRPGQPCTLCHPEARKGPQDCPTVALVMADPDLRAELALFKAQHRNAAVDRESA